MAQPEQGMPWRRAALAEAGAHLQHLVDSGRITATSDGPGQLEIFAAIG